MKKFGFFLSNLLEQLTLTSLAQSGGRCEKPAPHRDSRTGAGARAVTGEPLQKVFPNFAKIGNFAKAFKISPGLLKFRQGLQNFAIFRILAKISPVWQRCLGLFWVFWIFFVCFQNQVRATSNIWGTQFGGPS